MWRKQQEMKTTANCQSVPSAEIWACPAERCRTTGASVPPGESGFQAWHLLELRHPWGVELVVEGVISGDFRA
jgi:hypothetical protein